MVATNYQVRSYITQDERSVTYWSKTLLVLQKDRKITSRDYSHAERL